MRPRIVAARHEPAPSPAWRLINGWKRLAQLPDPPELEPYDFVVRAVVDSNTQGATATGFADLDHEGDFYAIAASMLVWDPATEVEGFTSWKHSPHYWWAHAEILQGNGGDSLSNIPVSVGSIFGRGDRPFYYPAPWVIPRGTRVTVKFANGTQAGLGTPDDLQVQAVWHGFRMRGVRSFPFDYFLEPRLISTLRDYREQGFFGRPQPYFYSMFTGHDHIDPGLGHYIPMSTETPSFTVTGGDFIGVYLMHEFYDEQGTPFFKKDDNEALGFSPPGHLAQLLIDEGRVKLQDRAFPINNLFGHGKRFMKLPRPLIIRDGQSLTMVVTPDRRPAGTSVQQIYKGHFTFAGVRIPRAA